MAGKYVLMVVIKSGKNVLKLAWVACIWETKRQ